jgi:hypothetical protein
MAKIKFRRDTAAAWTLSNPTLAQGEPGFEYDTGLLKLGDGSTPWNLLDYSNGGSLTSTSSIQVETGDADRWFVRLRREDETNNPQWDGVTVYSTNYDSEGNAIVVARINLNSDGIAVFKFTPAGELIWKKSLGAVNGSYYPESNVAIDSDDNILFAVNPDDSNTQIIVKINGVTGAVIFSEDLVLNQNFNVTAIAMDSENNIIIGGDFYYQVSDEDIAFVAKLNSSADTIIWQRSLMVDSGYSHIRALAVDFNDDIVIAGSAEVVHTISENTVTDKVMLVAKITSAGGSAWQKTVSLDEVNEGQVSGISLDSLGNIYATGSYWVDSPTSQQFNGRRSNAIVVFKMTAQGAMVWDRRVGPGECFWVGVSTAVGDDGDLYLYASTYQYRLAGEVDNAQSGYWNATLALARYNKATGAVIWQSYFDNPNAQEVPGEGNDAPWGGMMTDLMSVQGNKILIGGAVRLGQSGPDLDTPWGNSDYFNQGFLAQFDTAATAWSAEGWTLSTSRIPGKLTNTLVAVNGPTVLQNDINMSKDGSGNIVTQAVGVSVRRTASKVNTWTFGKDGTFSAPADANIKLNQRQLGYATMYGVFPNYNDDIWFESVCHDRDGFAYAVGSNYWNNSNAHIYKFTPEGAVVWATQLYSGAGARFNVSVVDGVYDTVTVDTGGNGYKVGDRIVISGYDLGGNNVNSLTLEVATITNSDYYVGSVDTVTIVSGTAVSGTNNYTGVQDYYDNAECQVRSMTFDPVTGNPVVVITTPTFNGDTMDSEWTETVILQIDSGSGTVVNTTTLRDEGDVYAYDADVSSTGKIAVVGQKFNEYAEYGSVTPLAGSGVDKLWVAKADIDAEHFPGESFSNYSDWWITGSDIIDQVRVDNVNYYDGLTGATRQGSGAVFQVTIDSSNLISGLAVTTGGTNYLPGHKLILDSGDFNGGIGEGTDVIITITVVDGSGGITGATAAYSGPGSALEGLYTNITSTPYQTGNGATFYAQFDPTTGVFNYGGINTVGQNYVVGDVITIPGTSFAGGTAPANNVTVNVTNVDGTALANPITISGSVPSTHLLLSTDMSVDFADVEATFAIKQNLDGEAFVWTPDMTIAIGGPTSDVFTGVAWNSTGTHLYAVGNGRYEVNYDQALVVKYSSTGTVLASKFVNDDMGEQDAYRGAVALMANDSIVVVHQMYNNNRDETDEILVTKLDSSLNIIWQQFIGVDTDDGWEGPESNISVAVDPATDEIVIAWEVTDYTDIINDQAIHIVKLDTDGEVVWKRLFGIHESDTQLNYEGYGNKALSIHGDQFTLVGFTDAPDDDTDNAFIVTLPLDGTGVGLHGLWTYAEPNDDKIKVWRLSGRTSTTFTPTAHSNGIIAVDNVKYYYTNYPEEQFTFYPQTILSNEGGAIEFADGSKQTFSTAIVPQVKISAGRYTLKTEDSGRHILVESENYAMVIPNWKKVSLPVGYTVTVINISGNDVRVECEYSNNGGTGELWLSGGDMKTPAIRFPDSGSGQMITLIKIKEGTRSDDAENHGDVWMVAGADIINDD